MGQVRMIIALVWRLVLVLCLLRLSLQSVVTPADSVTFDEACAQKMLEWGFWYFKTSQRYNRNKNCGLVSTFSDQALLSDFQLVGKLMAQGSPLAHHETLRLFELAELLEAIGEVRGRIFSNLFEALSTAKFTVPFKYAEMSIWSDFESYVIDIANGAILIDSLGIGIDGAQIDFCAKERTFQLFANLSKFYSGIVVKDVVINDFQLALLQASLHPHLASIYIENCPFNSTVPVFDLSALGDLTNLQIVNCNGDERLITVLESVRSELTDLNISNNKIGPKFHGRLQSWLSKMTQLKSLNVAGNLLTPKSASGFIDMLFSLPHLISLDLSYNPMGAEFVHSLANLSRPLQWETLNIAETMLSYFDFERFSRNFTNLPRLTCLNIFTTQQCFLFESFSIRFKHLSSLKQLIVSKKHSGHFQYFLEDTYPQVQFLFRDSLNKGCFVESEKEYFLGPDLRQLHQALPLKRIGEYEYGQVKRLSLITHRIALLDFQIFSGIVSKLSNLGSLRIHLQNDDCFRYVAKLLENRRLDCLSIYLMHCFTKIDELATIIDCLDLKSLKVSGTDNSAPIRALFVEKLTNSIIWKNLESLELQSCLRAMQRLMNNVSLPKLQCLTFHLQDFNLEDTNFIPIPSVKSLFLHLETNKPIHQDQLLKFLEAFPCTTKLVITATTVPIEGLFPSRLMKGLQEISIEKYSGNDVLALLQDLSNLVSLTRINIETTQTVKQLCLKRSKVKLANVLSLRLLGTGFHNIRIQAPWLRFLTIDNLFQNDWLSNLKTFASLGEIYLSAISEQEAERFVKVGGKYLVNLYRIDITVDQHERQFGRANKSKFDSLVLLNDISNYFDVQSAAMKTQFPLLSVYNGDVH